MTSVAILIIGVALFCLGYAIIIITLINISLKKGGRNESKIVRAPNDN